MTLKADFIARSGAGANGRVAIDVMSTCFSRFGADRPGIYPWAGEFKGRPPPNLPHFEGRKWGRGNVITNDIIVINSSSAAPGGMYESLNDIKVGLPRRVVMMVVVATPRCLPPFSVLENGGGSEGVKSVSTRRYHHSRRNGNFLNSVKFIRLAFALKGKNCDFCHAINSNGWTDSANTAVGVLVHIPNLV